MKSIIYFIFIFCTMSLVQFGQVFESISPPMKLEITYSAYNDSINPTLILTKPLLNIIPNKPIYTQDTIIFISGKVYDDKGFVKLIVNENFVSNSDSLFNTEVKVLKGLNTIVVKAIDRKGNKTVKSVDIYSDYYVDLDKPEINILIPSFSSRGINIVPDEESKSELNLDSSSTLVRVQVFDDSKIYDVRINNEKMAKISNDKYEFNFVKNLPDTLIITATDEYGNKATKVKYLNPQKANPMFTEQIFAGNYYGLIIANQDYDDKNIPSLSNPISDAKKLKNVLTQKYNFLEENIVFLTNAGRYDIFSAFSELRKKITPNDNLLIFYAGHGSFDKEMEQGFWLPSDASFENESNWISNSDIRDRIRSIDTKHTLLIADACFSGGIFQSRSFFNVSPSIKQTYSLKSRKAITSGYLEFVPDKSVFLDYLIQRLNENADEYLTASTLYTMMKDAVTNNSQNNQTPIYGTILRAGDEGGYGDFVFIKK